MRNRVPSIKVYLVLLCKSPFQYPILVKAVQVSYRFTLLHRQHFIRSFIHYPLFLSLIYLQPQSCIF